MQKLADISRFEALQNAQNAIFAGKAMSNMSVFNTSIEDIQTSVQTWMAHIDDLRGLSADSEAESEEGKLENILGEFDERIQSAIRTTRQTVADAKRRSGTETSSTEDTGGMDFGSTSGVPSDLGGGASDLGGDIPVEDTPPEDEQL